MPRTRQGVPGGPSLGIRGPVSASRSVRRGLALNAALRPGGWSRPSPSWMLPQPNGAHWRGPRGPSENQPPTHNIICNQIAALDSIKITVTYLYHLIKVDHYCSFLPTSSVSTLINQEMRLDVIKIVLKFLFIMMKTTTLIFKLVKRAN